MTLLQRAHWPGRQAQKKRGDHRWRCSSDGPGSGAGKEGQGRMIKRKTTDCPLCAGLGCHSCSTLAHREERAGLDNGKTPTADTMAVVAVERRALELLVSPLGRAAGRHGWGPIRKPNYLWSPQLVPVLLSWAPQLVPETESQNAVSPGGARKSASRSKNT